MKYLLDASSFILLIKKADAKTAIECFKDSLILDLTFYEVGNAIWKESLLTNYLTHKQAEQLGTLAQTILAKISQITNESEDFQKILEVARTEKLSYYDSSYIYSAKKTGLSFVTEDKELKLKAKKYTTIHAIGDLLSMGKFSE